MTILISFDFFCSSHVDVMLVSGESFNRGTMRLAMQFISKTEPSKRPKPDKNLAGCGCCLCVLVASSCHHLKFDGGTHGLCTYNIFFLSLYSYLFQLPCQPNYLRAKIPEFILDSR